MQHFKISPWPASWRQLSRGVMNIAHIVGAALFPCPRYCGGGVRDRAHFSPPYVASDSPKSVITECSMF